MSREPQALAQRCSGIATMALGVCSWHGRPASDQKVPRAVGVDLPAPSTGLTWAAAPRCLRSTAPTPLALGCPRCAWLGPWGQPRTCTPAPPRGPQPQQGSPFCWVVAAGGGFEIRRREIGQFSNTQAGRSCPSSQCTPILYLEPPRPLALAGCLRISQRGAMPAKITSAPFQLPSSKQWPRALLINAANNSAIAAQFLHFTASSFKYPPLASWAHAHMAHPALTSLHASLSTRSALVACSNTTSSARVPLSAPGQPSRLAWAA